MKRLAVLAGFAVFLLGLAGCGQQKKLESESLEAKSREENVLPEFLVGKWKADRHDWVFTFELGGRISSIVHDIWALPIDLEEGGYYIEGPDPNTYAVFIMGPCEIEYEPATRELSVKIIMDMYEIKTPAGTLSGRREDYFDGPVSEDGRTWHARWRAYEYLEGAAPPDIDYVDAHPESLVFTKVDTQQ